MILFYRLVVLKAGVCCQWTACTLSESGTYNSDVQRKRKTSMQTRFGFSRWHLLTVNTSQKAVRRLIPANVLDLTARPTQVVRTQMKGVLSTKYKAYNRHKPDLQLNYHPAIKLSRIWKLQYSLVTENKTLWRQFLIPSLCLSCVTICSWGSENEGKVAFWLAGCQWSWCSWTTAVRCALQLTAEVTLGSQTANAQPEDRELVQFSDDVLMKRQQAGQPLQLSVQSIAVPLRGIWLCGFGWRLLHTAAKGRKETRLSS